MNFKFFVRHLFRTPFIKWFFWSIKTFFILIRNKGKHWQIGQYSKVNKSNLGYYVTLKDYVNVSNSKIGDCSYVSKNSKIRNADIGKFCSLGQDILIGLGYHPIDLASTHPIFYSSNSQIGLKFRNIDLVDQTKRITIGHDVWVGSRVIILDGVVIGNGAVIGAGAVVTKEVPPYAVVAGVPARTIKFRNKPQGQLKNWWDNDLIWIRENIDLFSNKIPPSEKY